MSTGLPTDCVLAVCHEVVAVVVCVVGGITAVGGCVPIECLGNHASLISAIGTVFDVGTAWYEIPVLTSHASLHCMSDEVTVT